MCGCSLIHPPPPPLLSPPANQKPPLYSSRKPIKRGFFMNIESLLSKSTEKGLGSFKVRLGSSSFRLGLGSFKVRFRLRYPSQSSCGVCARAVSNKSYASCIPFNSLDSRQPFNISIASNCLLLVDFHCHLTKNEVVGYLGGTWDPATCNLAILQAFPCRTKLGDNDNAQVVEEEIRRAMEQRHLAPVGWYHSHPYCPARPTVQDTKLQQGYQAALRGPSDSPGLPCIGLICAPYTDKNHFEAEYLCYWVLSEGETKLEVVGQPMQMMYNMSHDSFLTQDLLTEMRLLSDYYRGATDAIHFTVPFQQGLSHWEKLKCSLRSKLPRDLQPLGSPSSAQAQAVTHFWDFLKGLILT
ncbi:MPND [Cordylochernes scorpioides]|uniref:MPND n=1 Tax=Cordylochernes scorpioides TaxID=51811 RepID=A0ABY6KSF7_9ARAC|nr:MPND [Cordylochernes scorpioides]